MIHAAIIKHGPQATLREVSASRRQRRRPACSRLLP